MQKQIKTINLKGNKYAKVADRLDAFREANPNSKISTENTTENGVTIFKAYIWKNKADFIELLKNGASKEVALMSCDAEGSARSDEKKIVGEKGFEKLETVAVGRALAILGYSMTGEVASSEEMEAFYAFKADKAIEDFANASDIDTLKKLYLELPIEVQSNESVIEAKDAAKVRLTEEAEKELLKKSAKVKQQLLNKES